jgi:putative ATP-binding cassette transporter
MLYALIRAELPETIVVGVGHRTTLDSLHAGRLELAGGGAWTISDPLVRRAD